MQERKFNNSCVECEHDDYSSYEESENYEEAYQTDYIQGGDDGSTYGSKEDCKFYKECFPYVKECIWKKCCKLRPIRPCHKNIKW